MLSGGYYGDACILDLILYITRLNMWPLPQISWREANSNVSSVKWYLILNDSFAAVIWTVSFFIKSYSYTNFDAGIKEPIPQFLSHIYSHINVTLVQRLFYTDF